jgi:hypothetical protein
MPAAANNDNIIGRLWLRLAPDWFPAFMPRQSFLENLERRIPHDLNLYIFYGLTNKDKADKAF